MFLNVNDDVAGNVPVDPEDTLKVKKALNRIGRYEVPSYGMTKYPDQPMLDGIKQIQRDHKLFLDGTIKPKGPTESAINKELSQLVPASLPIPNPRPPILPDQGDRCGHIQTRMDYIKHLLDTVTDEDKKAKYAAEYRDLSWQLSRCKFGGGN